MLSFIRNNRWVLMGIVVGAIGGYAYYYFVGCASGSCLITSRPLNSTVYGALMGAILFTGFKKENKSNSNNKKVKTDNNE